MKYKEGQEIKAMYHDNKIVSGVVLSSRQQYKGFNHPTTTTYTIRPNRPVMTETITRDRLIVSSDIIVN